MRDMRARIVALAAALWRARAADEAALAASVSTDASGLFTLGYYWYGILRQPSFHEEFEKCYDAMDLDGYYGYGLVAYCQFLDYFIDDSAMCKMWLVHNIGFTGWTLSVGLRTMGG